MKKERIVVICPGRGSYTREELNYFGKYRVKFGGFIDRIDGWRRGGGEPTVSELDGANQFQISVHTPGENASILIHACAMVDMMAIDPDRYEIVAVTGNSLGWYLALAAAGALDEHGAFTVVNTMGSMMRAGVVGGQLIYPVVDQNWIFDAEKAAMIERCLKDVNDSGDGKVYSSIYLGGYRVIGGDEAGLRSLMRMLPVVDERYPFKLINHAAFHTPVLAPVSQKAFGILGSDLFHAPKIPMIDGRGKVWQPYSTDSEELRQYTLGHQVTAAYDFTAAITVALKEFAPDRLVLLGPGATLGGSIGQILIQNQWQGIRCKADFAARQEKDPFLLSMGRLDQWNRLVPKDTFGNTKDVTTSAP
jgi:acyl transferase domain-containing protein